MLNWLNSFLFSNRQRAGAMQSLLRAPRRTWTWWLDEWRAIFSTPFGLWLAGKPRYDLIVEPRQQEISLTLRRYGHNVRTVMLAASDITPRSIRAFLSEAGVPENDVVTRLRLDEAKFYVHELFLPASALREAPRLLSEELKLRTPFQLEKIVLSHKISRHGHDRIKAEQIVLKRDWLDAALRAAALPPASVASVEVAPSERRAGAISTISLRQRDQRRLLGAACSVGILVLSGIAIGGDLITRQIFEQSETATAIRARIDSELPEAQKVRAMIDAQMQGASQQGELRARKITTTPIAELLEDLTRLLPEHTWLTEVRIVDAPDLASRHVTISGYSGNAAGLVGSLGGLGGFIDVALSGPISFEAREGRERFSLQMRTVAQKQVRERATP
jgi:general secretion pathway protein L